MDWDLAYIMPNTGFSVPVENEFLAIVPPIEQRLVELCNSSIAVRQLVSCFTDQFGRTVRPSAMLIRSAAPSSIDFYPVASFRNAVAISAIMDAWSFKLSGGNAGYPLWSDYFDFYPFSATKDGNEIIGRSMAMMELDEPTKFCAQKAPHLPSHDRLSFGIDDEVLPRVLRHWEQRFFKNRQSWESRVVFRSLEIACQACRMPAVGTRTPTIHDLGVGIALWVSALEILSHPRSGKASLSTVLALLKKAGSDWLDWRLRTARYKVQFKGSITKVTLVQKLYAELYQARNDFLHGNPVSRGSVFVGSGPSRVSLLQCAPLIYRTALMAFMPRTPRAPKVPIENQIADYLVARSVQSRYENAILSCR